MAHVRSLVRHAAGIFAVLAALVPIALCAQALPTLHVTALAMRSDKGVVAVAETFHVTIHAHVTERRDRLDELVLPTIGNAVLLGDERRRVSVRGGTDFYEILTVAASSPGEATFTPAYLDAILPHAAHGLRYSSNALNVRVRGAAPIASVTRSIAAVIGGLVRGFLVALAVIVICLIGYVRLRPKRRPASPVTDRVELPAARIATPVRDPLRTAANAYRNRGDDSSLDVLRTVLFNRAGAGSGATMADALRALGTRDPALAELIAVAERARFAPLSDRAAAARDFIGLLDAYIPEREASR